MRPVRLELDGFVSFRSPATVDFTDADYFALVGPTGSGKSSLIDALTFALYGSVHRWGDAKIVKYALAPTATRATVRLVFDLGSDRYVAAREIRRSGANILHKSRLERLLDPAGTGAPDEETELLAHDSAVEGAVEDLLGLTFEQFCTCVVLPQGDFAEFLHASRSDRQKILLKLLGAKHYDAIARAANVRAAEARQRIDVARPIRGDGHGRAGAGARGRDRRARRRAPRLRRAGGRATTARRRQGTGRRRRARRARHLGEAGAGRRDGRRTRRAGSGHDRPRAARRRTAARPFGAGTP
jgi:exonuclease SbcC